VKVKEREKEDHKFYKNQDFFMFLGVWREREEAARASGYICTQVSLDLRISLLWRFTWSLPLCFLFTLILKLLFLPLYSYVNC
jgi:hypothetical protein